MALRESFHPCGCDALVLLRLSREAVPGRRSCRDGRGRRYGRRPSRSPRGSSARPPAPGPLRGRPGTISILLRSSIRATRRCSAAATAQAAAGSTAIPPAQCTDSDDDGTCDGLDSCPGSDDYADADIDSIPDGCDSCPAGLILTAREVISTVVYESCTSITAGDGFHILDPGIVTFRAGDQVVLGNGFSVRTGATFEVNIDP